MNEFFKKPVVKILMLKGEKGDKGNTGTGTPKGGKTGQYLLKKSDADYDYVWSPITTVSWDNVSGKTNATENASGLMSAEDKSKLDNLQVGGRNLLVKNTIAFQTIESSGSVSVAKNRLACDFIDCRNAENITIVIHDIGSFKGVRFAVHFYDETKNHIRDGGWINTEVGNKNIISLANGDEYFRYIRVIFSFSETSEVVTTGTTESNNPISLDFVENKFKAKVEKFTTPTDWTPAPEDVDSKIDGVDSKIDALKSVTKSFTLSASSWSSGSYTISDALITATSNQEILPATTITTDQMKALQKANIIDSGQSAGSLTLKALGTVPTIDIPIRVIFRGTI